MKELSPWRIRRLAESDELEPEYARDSQSDEVHLLDYWNMLVKRRRIVLIVFLTVFAIGSYFVFAATTLYTAAATVKIEPQNPQVTGVGEMQSPSEGGGAQYDYYQTQFALLKSRPLVAKVITDLDLKSNTIFTKSRIVSPNPLDHIRSWVFRLLGLFSYVAPLFRSQPETENSEAVKAMAKAETGEVEIAVSPHLINRYNQLLFVNPVPKTRLVKVEFTTPDPTLSQVLANAHVQSFMWMNLQNRFSLTKEARAFLDQKKVELREKLEKSEAELNNFRQTHGVVSVEKGENIVVDRMVDVNRQLTAARAQRLEAESLYKTVENRNYQDLSEIMRQGIVQQLKSNMATLEAERSRLSTIFKPDHPRIQELGQQINAARQALSSEIANVVRGVKSGYAAALAKERALQVEADNQQRDALKLKALGVNYTVLQEEVNANRTLYQNVLKRLSETNVSNDIAVSNMQIAERAVRPLLPSSPNIPLYLLAIIMLGLFAGCGTAFAQEYMSSTLSTPEDVWRCVRLGTLGIVPDLKLLSQRKFIDRQTTALARPGHDAPQQHGREPAKELTVAYSPLSVISESYRSIRTALLLSQAEKPPQIILVTSPSPGEGKTVTSLNLSIALAQDEYSVLLIDGDMRKGCCHTRLALRNGKGLSEVLSGGAPIEECVQRTSVARLSLLSRGRVPPNPSELLGSRKMKQTLEALRATYDFVLIDSPPAITISDASVLSSMSDGVLLVLNGQTTSESFAKKAVEQLDMVRARLLGVVLNSVSLDNPSYSYFQSYSSYFSTDSAAADNFARQRNGKPADEEGDGFDAAVEVSPRPSDETKAAKNGKGEHDSTPAGANGHDKRNSSSGFEVFTGRGGKSPADETAAVASQEFMERLSQSLTEALGPVAPLVLREQVARLGANVDAFPKSRVGDLLRSLESQIVNPELKKLFQERKLGSSPLL